MARLPASFRGVAFFVDSTPDKPGGRVVITHDIPGKVQRVEDTGPETPEFTIEAFVIGADYATQLRKLEAALDQAGPGKLVHPYRGTKQVQVCGKYTVTQSTAKGGMATLGIQFIQAGKQAPARIQIDTAASVKGKAAFALSKLQAPKIDTDGPDFLTAAVNSLLAGPRGLTNSLSKINNGIASKLNLINDISTAVDDFTSQLNALIQTPSALALAVQDLINSVLTALGLTTDSAVANAKLITAAVSAITKLGSFADDKAEVIGTTTARNKQRVNQAAVVDLVEASAAATGMQVLADMALDNADQANDVLTSMSDLIDRLLERGTLDDDAAHAMRALRAAFHTHLRRTTKDLTGLGRITPPADTQALVLAWKLYGDAGRALEIVERNAIANPCVIPGGVEIAVPNA